MTGSLSFGSHIFIVAAEQIAQRVLYVFGSVFRTEFRHKYGPYSSLKLKNREALDLCYEPHVTQMLTQP